MSATQICQKCGKGSIAPICIDCERTEMLNSGDGLGKALAKNNYMQPAQSLEQTMAHIREKYDTALGRYDPLMRSISNYTPSQGIESRILSALNSSNTNINSAYKKNSYGPSDNIYNPLTKKSYNPSNKNAYAPKTNYGINSGKSYGSLSSSSYGKSGYSSKTGYNAGSSGKK